MKTPLLLIFFFLMSLLTFGQLSVTVPTQTATPGQTVYVPVKLYGANTVATAISSANIKVTYDPTKLTYVNLVNFYAPMPSSQWYYSGNFDVDCNAFTVAANWLESSLLTLQVPDGTTLFEIQFTYIGGNCPLVFCVYEFTDFNFDFILTTPTNGAVNANMVNPTLTGPTPVCQGSNGNVYQTDAGQTNYLWNVIGGTITSGGTNTDNTATITWNSAGAQSVSVSYTGSTVTTLPVTVNPTLPVSVSVAAAANPVCAGTSVTFTATPVNGGLAPSYQWKVNGVNAGTNSDSYSYMPANNDIVTVDLTSNATCPTGNPATSAPVTMTVNPLLPVSVSVSASANPVCAGTSVTFTATPVNGGLAPVYQWEVNGVGVGGNSSTYAYIPLNNDIVKVTLTSNATCPTGNPATSAPVSMMVNPLLPVSVSVAASANPVCAGTSVTFTATPVNGGLAPSYQWKVNGINAGTNSDSYSYMPLNTDIVTVDLTSSATCPTGNPATSAPVTMTVNPLLPVSVLVAASANPVCAGTSVTFTATPVNGGLAPSYQWKVNGVNAGTNSDSYSYIPVNTDIVTVDLTSNATCPSGNPATSAPVTMVVNPLLTVSVSVAASANPICTGNSVTYTATPVNGGSSPTYQWMVNGLNVGSNSSTYSYMPLNNDIVTVMLVSNEECSIGNPAISSPIIMSVYLTLPVSVSVVASANPTCSGSLITVNAVPVNGGTLPTYQWILNGSAVGVNSDFYSFIPANNDVIAVILTSSSTCATNNPATSTPVTLTVNPLLPVSVSVAASANPVCAGTSATFTATPVNGGLAPSYQWKVNGINAGINSDSYSYIPVNNDIVTVDLTSNATCPTGNPAASAPVTMTVNPLLPVSVSVAASANPVCAGTSVTFTATPVNGGLAPVYQWEVNGVGVGGNSSTYAYVPLNNDVVKVTLTSNATCPTGNPATSAPVTMTVNPLLPVSVLVAASANPVCAGTSVTFTANPTNEGLAPVYQWEVNGVGVGGTTSSYSYVPLNNDIVKVTLTSSETCATGNPATSALVTMTVNPLLPVSVSVVASANPVCAGTSATFTATPVNGGLAPSYQWKVNGVNAGTNSDSYTYIPVNNDIVTVDLTSNATCPTGNPAASAPVTMTVNPLLPVSVSVAASANPVCAGTSVTFTATPVNGGLAPVYQWEVNGIGVGGITATYTYVPSNNDVVRVTLTSNATCATGNPATSLPLTMTVNPNLPVSVSITPSANPVCSGTAVTFTAVPINGGSAPTYQWKVNGVNVGSNSNTYSYVPINNDVVTVVVTSNALCAVGSPAVSNAVTMTVTFLPAPIVTGPITACTGSTGNLYSTQAGMSNYAWVVSPGGTITSGGTSTSNTVTVTWNATGAHTVSVSYTNGGCSVAAPGVLNVTVSPIPAPTIVGSTSLCVNSGYYNYVTEAGMVNYLWTVSPGGAITFGQGTNTAQVTWNTSGSQWVAVTYTNTGGCSPAAPTQLNVTVNPLPAGAGNIIGPASVCGGANGVSYSVGPIQYATQYIWSLPTGATIVSGAGTNSILVDFSPNASSGNITVYGNNLCGNGSVSPPISLVVNQLPEPAGVITGNATACQGTTGYSYSIPPINNATGYVWAVPSGASIVSGGTANSIVVDFGLSATSGDVTVYGVNSCGSGSPSPPFAVTVTAIPPAPTVSLAGEVLSSSSPVGNQWYFEGAPIAGATGQTYQAMQTGWYWAVVTVNGCSSDTSNHVYVLIVGMQPLKGASVNIYPVPNDGKFTVSIDNPFTESYTIRVFSTLGSKVYEYENLVVQGFREKVVELPSLPEGIYTVVISSNDEKITRKMVVSRVR